MAKTIIPALFKPTFTVKTIVITKAQTDAAAEMARQMEVPPRDDPAWAENPAFPWEPNVCPQPVDCAVLDAARPGMECAA